MPKSCDPATRGEEFNEIAQDQGLVRLRIRYSWDGVTQWPSCDGPIEDIELVNGEEVTWQFFVDGDDVFAAEPGQTVLVTGQQLIDLGLERYSDLTEWTIQPLE